MKVPYTGGVFFFFFFCEPKLPSEMGRACSWNTSALIFCVPTDMKGQKITEDDQHSVSNVSEQGSVEKALQLGFRTDFTAIYHKIKLFQQLCSFLGSLCFFILSSQASGVREGLQWRLSRTTWRVCWPSLRWKKAQTASSNCLWLCFNLKGRLGLC